jgi:hypothetical protein
VITNTVITAPGVDERIDSIDQNKKRTLKFHFKGDGQLLFRTIQDETEFNGTIEFYVTGGNGGASALILENNGQYKIVTNNPGSAWRTHGREGNSFN